ncbi:hypothetical protein B9Z19DRAFT_1065759 [Tuber borchii]|uniref:Uncharacterized protein n=1 Tax=Tuber borchii TaxID=42251 RepID=A0A2T6ZPV0_TUBBO|nr:hypothetical protein B9Z19DRAFT_1065759 [Tuber borchii]
MPAYGEGTASCIPLLKRAAILTLNWHAQMSYRKIGTQLGISKSTVESIIKRAKACASDPEDFDDVLACLDSQHGGGNPKRFPEGCEESLALRDLSQKDKEHWLKTFPEVASFSQTA